VHCSMQNWNNITYPDTTSWDFTIGNGLSFVTATDNSGTNPIQNAINGIVGIPGQAISGVTTSIVSAVGQDLAYVIEALIGASMIIVGGVLLGS
jgi:hypothetical protein